MSILRSSLLAYLIQVVGSLELSRSWKKRIQDLELFHDTAPHCSAQHNIATHCTAPHHTAPLYITLHHHILNTAPVVMLLHGRQWVAGPPVVVASAVVVFTVVASAVVGFAVVACSVVVLAFVASAVVAGLEELGTTSETRPRQWMLNSGFYKILLQNKI